MLFAVGNRPMLISVSANDFHISGVLNMTVFRCFSVFLVSFTLLAFTAAPAWAQRTYDRLPIAKEGTTVDYLVGTMIEVPRAALTANRIAEVAEFFSFGTNDLTQMTMGLSRDDSGKFLPAYVEKKIYADDPFQVLDQEGVGQLVEIGIQKGRSTKPDLKVGICGEHGGEPESVMFCHRVGMNYVSCSPYRVPIALLAAAQAAIADEGGAAIAKTTV